MKKSVLAIVLALSMAVSAIPTFAANLSWEAVVDKSSVEVGETFNLDLDVTQNPGIQNATISIDYNPNVVIPVATVDPADDIISVITEEGNEVPLFGRGYVDSIIARTDVTGGTLKLANLISEYVIDEDSKLTLMETTTTGTLARITFKAVGEGDANIHFGDTVSIARTPKKSEGNIATSITIPSVTVTGGAKTGSTTVSTTNSESTTTTATTTTTKSSSSSNSTSTGSKTTTTTTTTATTTEATTEATTKVEATTETTTVATSFTDLSTHPWAIEYINNLAAKGIINGYNDNTFKPGNNVKRADFIIMLLKSMGVDTIQAPKTNFSDVRTDKYYYNAVGLAKELGIASGNNDGTFNPESNITRQDMMILAKKAIEKSTNKQLTGNTTVLDKFADKTTISPYATESLAAMVEAGIVSGTGNNIAPKNNTTRAESAVIISKILDYAK